MKVGVPKERKPGESRVALSPAGAREVVAHGHQVLIERDAGTGSRIPDEEYVAAGARIVPTAEDLFGEARLIVKVKEPTGEEIGRLGPDHVLFTFLHLAAYPSVASHFASSLMGIDATRPFGEPFAAKLVMDPARMAWARALVDRLGG